MISSLFRVNHNASRAFATLEYVMIVIILTAGLYGFWPYIQRGFQGQYQRTGASFGFGRQYNPGASRDCAYEPDGNLWYEQGCFNNERIRLDCAHKSSVGVNGADSAYDQCLDDAKGNCTLGCQN